MGRAEARPDFFHCSEIFVRVVVLKKNAENLGFLDSFSFTPRERSRMIRMSVRRKNYFSGSLYTGKNRTSLDKFKGETVQS